MGTSKKFAPAASPIRMMVLLPAVVHSKGTKSRAPSSDSLYWLILLAEATSPVLTFEIPEYDAGIVIS